MKETLIENIGRVHTTEMGVGRIKKNLGLGDIDDSIITVNASSYTVITAHKEKR